MENRRSTHAGSVAVLFLAAIFFCAPAAAFTGSFAGQLDGQPVSSVLREQAGNVSGSVEISGYKYRVSARISGAKAVGSLHDQAGVRVPIDLSLDGKRLTIAIYAQGRGGPATEISLQRDARTAPAPAAQARQIDPSLVGRWAKSDSYTSGDFSAASETSIHLLADGTYRFRASKLYGGGDAGSFGSQSAGGGEQGRWSTADRILYVLDAASGQWSAYARYYVEGNSALLTFGNGKREVWKRR